MSLVLPWLDPESLEFPDTATALRTPNGLLAVGGDLRIGHAVQPDEVVDGKRFVFLGENGSGEESER